VPGADPKSQKSWGNFAVDKSKLAKPPGIPW